MLDETQKIALDTIKIDKQAFIFLPSKVSAEKTAEEIAKLTSFNEPELEHQVLKALSSPTKQCRRLSYCIRKGIAFHHSGLTNTQKEVIENNFRNGKIKIICCTPTLAAGLSLPVFRVIIRSLKRYDQKWGMNWIPVLEYLQMAGRAGRPEYEKFGEAITIAKDENEKEEVYDRYICGVPEDIYSKLAAEPILRTHLLSLIATNIIRSHESMNQFFQKTFWAHQFQDFAKLETIIIEMLDLLTQWQFVITENGSDNKNYFIAAKQLIQKQGSKITATFLGKRISELYLDPLTAKHILECLIQFKEKQSPFSLLQMISHTLELRPLLTVKSKEQDSIQEELTKRYHLLLENEPSPFDLEYEEFINSFKTALFLEEWINEKEEDYLLERYDIRPGEIRVKLEIADWLLYASEELARITDNLSAVKEIRKLRSRLEYGIKVELLALTKLKGIGRIRARKLFNHGIKDIGDIKKTDLTTLNQILGKLIAEEIKRQVGEEIKEIPKGTRKGQLSIEKF